MGGDGNCLFRTIADQLEGNEKLHSKYRQEAVAYMEQNKDFFSAFIEDDETIDQYLGDIQKDGVWGGQLELTALSQKYQFNYVIHQVDNPSMAFSNYPWGTCPTIHLSYHLGEHYNSVRKQEDACNGVPLPIGHELKIVNPIEEQKEEEVPEERQPKKGAGAAPSAPAEDLIDMEEAIQYMKAVLGVTDESLARKALVGCFG